jgi:hypothetical protein
VSPGHLAAPAIPRHLAGRHDAGNLVEGGIAMTGLTFHRAAKGRRAVLALLAACLALTVSAGGAFADAGIDYETHSPPTFTLNVRPPDGYDVQIYLYNPMAYESRLDHVTVWWGDGTAATQELNPLIQYTRIGLKHRYPGKADTTLYGITVRLYDSDNLYRTASDTVRIYPLFDVILHPAWFYAMEDCDAIWAGEGDFTVQYWFENQHDGHAGGTVSADLGEWDGVLLFAKSKTFHNAGQWDYPVLGYAWAEDDGGLDSPPPTRRIDLWPQLGRFTRSYTSSQDGCDVLLRFDVTTRLVE